METRIEMLQEERSHVTSSSHTLQTQDKTIRRLKWAVGFCFVLLCTLALFTACLLQGGFPGRKDEGRVNPRIGTPLQAKPRAHLTVTSQNDTSSQVLQWESKLGLAFLKNGMIYSNKSIIVPDNGDYFVYSQLSFRPPCTGGTSISQSILKYTPRYPEPDTLLSGISFCTKDKGINPPIYLGGLFELEKGDKLMVHLNHVDMIDISVEHKTFFGAFLV
ncbi:hypothetical protein GDO81_003712 [Engystomops pustulosus]|uniref:THD domain-containing protein n=1 Tax=Engystomops pustulosus TaxID=76066 RepID=A0AAV6ZXZ0_ENGPU|nr:hypothetical protein GDO81_003712 [Engystomops pustulosus]